MTTRVLFSWIGQTDLDASKGILKAGMGPICQAVKERAFTNIVLLSNYKKEDDDFFVAWLKEKTDAAISKQHIRLTSPTDFREIYEAAVAVIDRTKRQFSQKDFRATYHLSPGTPAMAAIWIILSKTSHPAELIQSSREQGVKTVALPFDISADYLPDMLKPIDDDILKLTQGLPPESPDFDKIVHRCKDMKRIIAQARRLAVHDVPVLIQGESGTGKELFARAIHTTGPRKDKPFIAVNCGSIPQELVESEFFGHIRGSFTGAIADRKGYFESADGGTLFLDEIGELPLPAQVKLLRAIQESKIMRIGDSKPKKIDVRIIAATNRNLIEEVAAGRFRDDLFHRIAVGVLKLLPLRDRQGDLTLVIDHILDDINKKSEGRPGWKSKKLSAGARNLLNQHPWPGNVRELYNTLSRAAILIAGETIEIDDIREALFPVTHMQKDGEDILNRSLGEGFNLDSILAEVEEHYLKRAFEQSKRNRSKAAKLLGITSYQTFSNRLGKYGTGD